MIFQLYYDIVLIELSRGVTNMNCIQVTRSSMPSFEEYSNEIRKIWDSCWLTNCGVKHQQFEADLKEYLSVPNVSLFANGHLALETLITAMNLHGEVITTPFTFASTTHAIVRCGLNPVFCDIRPDDYTIDADKIEALITEKTAAILPVHVYGSLCDVDRIQDIANKYSLKVIYDAAHAFGVSKNGISAASFGDASMFSFHATKVFHSIEGGAVTCHDSLLQQKLSVLRNFGISDPEEITYISGNGKMNEFSAAMGLCNLRHLDKEIEKRKLVFDHYVERLSACRGIQLLHIAEGVNHNYAYFPVLFHCYKYNRDEVFQRLADQNIIARKYFYPLTNSFSCYRGRPGFCANDTPVAKMISSQILCLPLYADLAISDVDRICDIIIR